VKSPSRDIVLRLIARATWTVVERRVQREYNHYKARRAAREAREVPLAVVVEGAEAVAAEGCGGGDAREVLRERKAR